MAAPVRPADWKHSAATAYAMDMMTVSSLRISRVAVAVAILGGLLLLVAGPGTRLGTWDYGTGFLLMRIAFFTGLGVAVLAIALLIVPKARQRHAGLLTVALVIGLATAWVPWSGYRTVMSLPFIHDITTDTVNPPQFVAIAPLRADAPNPVDYAGEEVARQQRNAYPDIQTLEFSQPADSTFREALAVAKDMGWEIVAADPEAGRIEATATTFWFGFKDDVVIRVESMADGSRLDIRSKSRVGRSDVGKNAARIREFTGAIKNRSLPG